MILENNIRFHEQIKRQEDYLFSIMLLRFVNKYTYVGMPLYHYIKGKNSLSTRYSPSLALSETLVAEEEKLLVKEKPEFEDQIPFSCRRVLTAVKLSYNNCCTDSTVARRERISYLNGLLDDEGFMQQLQDCSSGQKLVKVFRFFMLKRMCLQLDLAYQLIHRLRGFT